MKYLFLSPPATGEMQPTLAVAEALLSEDPTSTIYIGSGSSFQSRYETLISTISSDLEDRLFRIDLGGTDDVEDYSHNMLKKNKNKNPELFQSHRHERGNPIPFFNYWAAFAAGSQSQRIATIQRTLKIINRLKPDMIVVDQIYGTPFDAVRYSRLPFIMLAPGHPSFAADVNPIFEPLSMSGIEWRGSLSNIISNVKMIYKLVTWIAGSQWAWTTLKLRRRILGFPWLSLGADSTITPPPARLPQVCAAIMCNVENLNFYNTSWPPKCHFVGPCFRPSLQAQEFKDVALMEWLDSASEEREDVVFISFGSMFPFNQADYSSMINALEKVHEVRSNLRVLWKVVTCDDVKKLDLPFLRQVEWLESVAEVCSHSAVKVVIHHGGGNTVNEVIHHGLKHLVIPQWSDTYDWGATISSFGLGEQVDNSGPHLETQEIASKLLKLLENPDDYKDNIAYWQRRSRESKGSKGAARIVHQAALEQASQYADVYTSNRSFTIA
ncbi:glycosyltransferase family 1 protein [Cystobasidium minutum MCA 4210]|uniref:glycosyltransferase family 1 protein n=1 Tax=Cystobasidium minutum MCA 4210 TaxID=1397322 RepID=UPI0034CD5C2C|eukprot:jgi/Rhomi1/198755/gm1.6969_g